MQSFICNRAIGLLCFLLVCLGMQAQETIQQVQLQKGPASSYRIFYELRKPDSASLQQLTLRIYRRRDGAVTEIFSKDITDAGGTRPGVRHSYNWPGDTAQVRAGDELQARLSAVYQKAARPVTVANKPPRADAGPDQELRLPFQGTVALNGLRSYDEDGKIVSMKWQQLSGPSPLRIAPNDFYKAEAAGEWKAGRYLLQFTVRDSLGGTASDEMTIVVRPLDVVPPPVAATPPAARRDTAQKKAVAVQKPAPPPVRYEMPRLKGGPANAAVNLLLPGLGHYFVSGDHYGNDRKPQVLLISALYGGAIGGAVYYKLKSNSEYKRYTALSEYREYQRDNDGNIIGVRGANQGQATTHLSSAQTAHKNFLILAGVSAGILAADFVYTFFRGLKNQRAWKREAGVSWQPFVAPAADGLSAGVVVKFGK